jgi:hypothetical protein
MATHLLTVASVEGDSHGNRPGATGGLSGQAASLTQLLSGQGAKISKLVYERIETRSLRAAYWALGLNKGPVALASDRGAVRTGSRAGFGPGTNWTWHSGIGIRPYPTRLSSPKSGPLPEAAEAVISCRVWARVKERAGTGTLGLDWDGTLRLGRDPGTGTEPGDWDTGPGDLDTAAPIWSREGATNADLVSCCNET